MYLLLYTETIPEGSRKKLMQVGVYAEGGWEAGGQMWEQGVSLSALLYLLDFVPCARITYSSILK